MKVAAIDSQTEGPLFTAEELRKDIVKLYEAKV